MGQKCLAESNLLNLVRVIGWSGAKLTRWLCNR